MTAAMRQLNAVVHRQTVAMLRLNGRLVHQRTADAMRVRYRVRRHENSRATIVLQHRRRSARRVRRNSDHRLNACHDLCRV